MCVYISDDVWNDTSLSFFERCLIGKITALAQKDGMCWAGDERLAGFALGMEAVERLFESFLGRLARVDRAPELPDNRLGHARLLAFRPKNTHPFQRVPVMARAMAERDR